MSAEAVAWAYRQTPVTADGKVSPGAKQTLVAIAEMTAFDAKAQKHVARPGFDKLTEMTLMPRRTLSRHVQVLLGAGLIERRHRNEGFSKRATDEFTLPIAMVVLVPQRADSTRVKMTGDKVAPSVTTSQSDPGQSGPIRTKDQDLKSTPSRPAASRGTRIPSDWRRSPADAEWQMAEGIPDSFARQHTAEFRDYWVAKPGAGGVKLDWSATWRNWMRRAWRERPVARDTSRTTDAAEAVRRRAVDPLASAR